MGISKEAVVLYSGTMFSSSMKPSIFGASLGELAISGRGSWFLFANFQSEMVTHGRGNPLYQLCGGGWKELGGVVSQHSRSVVCDAPERFD